MKEVQNIISLSRKTDFNFYYDNFQKAFKDKSINVVNPYNQKVSTVNLSIEKSPTIVFWSKNYANLLNNIGEFEPYNKYFEFTITGYNKILEPNVINHNVAVKQMEQLANKYRSECIMWRFDPILLSLDGEYNPTKEKVGRARLDMFESLCKDISSIGVKDCSISFISLYGAVEKRLSKCNFKYVNLIDVLKIKFIERMVEIAGKYDVQLYTCANALFENVPGILKGHCIDGERLDKLFGTHHSHKKDKGQRKECGCTESKDIGSYDLKCKHNCLYCYARPDI